MLRSLELFGFKSFADKTVFEFHDGITGVVGPNGSGKSNVVDSIKWLLGDQSAKSLRGKEMTDVIFNGSTSRTGAQFAEATLTFDNSTRFLPMDHDVVSVGRRLWKTGDSEYLINQNVARLKDVRELLMGTGAGAASYCIIEQGRVDQILQSNAANRRLIFEEAAGISRFKQRKTEAERRLERVEQNLLRLTDIVDEVESQVNSIRSQAQRATKYRRLSTELEALWVGMCADDFRRQSMVRDQLEAQRLRAAEALDVTRAHQKAAEEELQNADADLSAVDDGLREVEHRRAELRSRIASLKTTLRHQSARDAELQSEITRLHRQRSVMNSRVAEAEKEQAHLQNVLKLEQQRYEEQTTQQQDCAQRLQRLHAELDAAQQEIETQRAALIQLTKSDTEASGKLAALRHEHQLAQNRRAELDRNLHKVSEQVAATEAELKAAESRVAEAQERLHGAEEAVDQMLDCRDTLLNQQSESKESLADLREQRSAAVARKTVLEDLEDRHEGFGIGAREILRRAEQGSIEPWNHIHGSVADLLDVDMENAALLEVALSGRAQLLVTSRLGPVVDYLNSGRCHITGRVGFVSIEHAQSETVQEEPDSEAVAEADSVDEAESSALLNSPFDIVGDWEDAQLSSVSHEFIPSLKVTWVDENGEIPQARSVFTHRDRPVRPLKTGNGIVGRADSLARSPSHLPSLATLLLADTWVVESLDDALRLQAELGADYRFVTLQGELVEKDGVLLAGTVRAEAAVVSRKSELRRLKTELTRIEHLIAEREIRLQNLVKSLETTDSDLLDHRTHVDRLQAAFQETQGHQKQLQQKLDTYSETRTRVTADLEAADGELQNIAERIDADQVRRTEQEAKIAELQQVIADRETSLTDAKREVTMLQQQRNEADLIITRSEERLSGITDACQRLDDDLEQRRLQEQEATRRLVSGRTTLDELVLSRLNAAAEAAELSVDEERLTTDINARARSRIALRERKNAAAKAEQQAREVRREHEQKFHEIELQINAIDHQLETAAERIEDEFQISVEDAVRDGRSGIAAWLTRQAQLQQEATDADGEDDNSQTASVPGQAESEEVTIDDPQVQQILRDTERYDTMRSAIDQQVNRLKRQLRKLGNVGMDSLDNLTELETRFERLHSQLKDLEAARDTLREMVRQINVESRRMFEESFECIRNHFRELFRRLFGGGEADVILEDPEDVLDCAIDVVARPPGKELRSISLLSGGEKTMTAVALLLAIFRSRPSPFCILDEVDAALDDANIGRFVGVLKEFQQETQFIMITHRKPTMAVTDVLYGVTMEESGVSKRLVVRFEEIDDKGNFVPRQQEQKRAA